MTLSQLLFNEYIFKYIKFFMCLLASFLTLFSNQLIFKFFFEFYVSRISRLRLRDFDFLKIVRNFFAYFIFFSETH